MEDQNKIIQEGLSSDDVKKRQKKNSLPPLQRYKK